MARLVDVDKLISNLGELVESGMTGNKTKAVIKFAIQMADAQPIVDAVEVVRCKDCVYCKRFNDVYQLPKLDVLICRYCCDEDEVTENDYCSWGIRKDETD